MGQHKEEGWEGEEEDEGREGNQTKPKHHSFELACPLAQVKFYSLEGLFLDDWEPVVPPQRGVRQNYNHKITPLYGHEYKCKQIYMYTHTKIEKIVSDLPDLTYLLLDCCMGFPGRC